MGPRVSRLQLGEGLREREEGRNGERAPLSNQSSPPGSMERGLEGGGICTCPRESDSEVSVSTQEGGEREGRREHRSERE